MLPVSSRVVSLFNVDTSPDTSAAMSDHSDNTDYVLNLSPSAPDHRDYSLQIDPDVLANAVLHPVTKAPIRVGNSPIVKLSWRSYFRYVFNQLNLGSCTANAGCQLFAFEMQQMTNPYSRLFLYYNTRALQNTINSDSGASIRNTIRAMQQRGTPLETVWPYIVNQFRTQPSARAYASAVKLPSNRFTYATVPVTVQDWKAVLQAGQLIIFGMYVYDVWNLPSVQRTGDIPFPTTGSRYLGGHALLVVGFDDVNQRFNFLNSWGTGWGDRGFGTLPYSYLRARGLVFDSWTIF